MAVKQKKKQTTPKTRTLYRETYNAPYLRIYDCFKPKLSHQAPGFEVDEAFVMASGVVQTGDERAREYQDIRVFFKPQAVEPPAKVPVPSSPTVHQPGWCGCGEYHQ